MERIEPIRRDDAPRHVPAVAPVMRRERDRQDNPRDRRRRQAPTVVTRDDDGKPHVDIRA
jgi:hypothetical protein